MIGPPVQAGQTWIRERRNVGRGDRRVRFVRFEVVELVDGGRCEAAITRDSFDEIDVGSVKRFVCDRVRQYCEFVDGPIDVTLNDEQVAAMKVLRDRGEKGARAWLVASRCGWRTKASPWGGARRPATQAAVNRLRMLEGLGLVIATSADVYSGDVYFLTPAGESWLQQNEAEAVTS